MRAAVEISMYPLTGDYRPPIRAFIDRLHTHGELEVLTNALSTQVWGPLDRVMAILAEEMRRAADGPQLVFVMKVLPGLAAPGSKSSPADESSAELPTARAPSADALRAEAPSTKAYRAEAPSAEASGTEAPSAGAQDAELPSPEAQPAGARRSAAPL